MSCAKINHLLCFGYAADIGTGKALSSPNKVESTYRFFMMLM